MSKMRIVMFAVAAGSAVMAGVLAKGMLGKKQETRTEVINKVKTVDVLFAAKDVQVGEKLAAGTVVWKAWPAENVIDAMITRDEKPDAEMSLAEYRALVPTYEGETINEKKLVDPKGGGFMSAVLPKGMRAVSMAIRETSSAGGFILPNDRVDVIITRNLGNNLVKGETVITNVRVLAINQTFRKAQEGEEVAIKGEVATIEVNMAQAEVLARVEREGELSLALRSIAESEGRPVNDVPVLAEKYRTTDGGKKRNTDTLIVRYGVETYATSN